jgi:hypothetical protein
LHPEREPLEILERIRRTVGEYNFAGQYQQTPAPLGGGMVKAEWFKHYRANERPERFERIVQSWDTANKATELSDFSVCTTWGVRGKDLFLLNVLRKRLEYPALKRAVREQHSQFNANVVLIEDKASGTQLIQELIADGCPDRLAACREGSRAVSCLGQSAGLDHSTAGKVRLGVITRAGDEGLSNGRRTFSPGVECPTKIGVRKIKVGSATTTRSAI